MLGHHSISEYPISSIKVLSGGIEAGSFTLSGQAVNLVKTGSSGYVIQASVGVVILTGKAVTLTNAPNEIGSDSGNSHTKLLKRIKSQNELILQLVKAYYD